MPLDVSIFAFFNHPAMLAWLAAASAPLIIHLLSRRRFRETQWAAMQFLLAAAKKNSRRIRIEQWLLLAVRTLLIVLIVLALAEPYLSRSGLTLLRGGRTHKVLVLDASYSMGYKPNDKNRFDQARELAASIIAESRQGDGFTLVLLATPPRVVVGTPVFERNALLAELDAAQMVDTGADLPATLAKIEEVLQQARREYARLSREEIYFFTDLGRNTWMPNLRGPGAVTDFRDRCGRLAKTATFIVADLGQEGAENVAVTSLHPLDAHVTLARDTTLVAELRNFGRQSHSHRRVELFIDERRAGETHIDLPAGENATAVFRYRFDAPGEHAVEVRAAGDALDVDNHRWLALPAVSHLRVLCVNGRPAGGDFKGATDYLMVALAPSGPTDERSIIRPEIVTERALLEADLAQYDAVFLCDVAQFTAGEARALDRYVRGGGGLVIFLGGQVQADSYNRQLGDQPGGVGLLPAKVGQLAGRKPQDPYLFSPLNYRHPIVAAFRGRDRAGLITAPTQNYIRLTPGDSSQVALGFSSGDPAIVEQQVGGGRSILVATSADASWTNWPLFPSYVPIVQELVAAAVRGRVEQRSQMVGQPLSGSLSGQAAEAAVAVELPDGARQLATVAADGSAVRWNYAKVDRSGIYRVEHGPPLAKVDLYAANLDTAESDLARVNLDELRDDVWPGIAFESFDGRVASEAPNSPIVRRDALHHWLLYAALALLLFETALASWLGRRSA